MRSARTPGHWRDSRGRRRPSPPLRAARAGLIVGLELAVAVTIASILDAEPGASAAASDSVSVDLVASAPASYRGPEVVVRGRVAKRPTRVSTRDRSAFVLAGKDGGRLLVVPSGPARLKAFRVGTMVVVRGAVVLTPSSRRLARRPATRTAVAKRAHAPALIKATSVSYEGAFSAGT
jgi:hypothetical protein